MSELNIIKKLMMKFSKEGNRLWRVNTGTGWTGNKIRRIQQRQVLHAEPGDVLIKNARPFRTGLPKGFPDCVGYTTVKIEESHLGKTLAVFTAIEVKTKTVPVTTEQKDFLNQVLYAGGIAEIHREE